MSEDLVVLQGLTKRFAGSMALDDCSLRIARGEVFGLLGPNGAGKSTLLRLLMGFLKPTSGSASIAGVDCYRERILVHRLCSYLPGDARLFRAMTGRQVLQFFASARPDGDLPAALALADRLELNLSRWVAFMSTGMRQKLALAAVLSVPAQLTILDEPTANLDPTVRGEVLRIIAEIRRSGRTVVFSSHVLSEVEEVCDRVAILRAGKLVHEQSMEELRQWYRIRGRVPESSGEGFLQQMEELRSFALEAVLNGESGVVTFAIDRQLEPALKWLARNHVSELEVLPNGLRTVYDRHHAPAKGVQK